MNNESSSALQKATLVLLIFIAAALGYLIMRDYMRTWKDVATAPETDPVVGTPVSAPVPFSTPSETKISVVPLRPRRETNVLRGPTNRVAVVRPEAPTLARLDTASEIVVVPSPFAHSPGLPVPAAVSGGFSVGARPGALVSGRVILQGTPPPEKMVTLDAMCGRLHPEPMTTRHFVIGQDSGLANVFVYVKSGVASQKATQAVMPLLDNIRCEFQPYVLGVRAGQPFQIRNSDPVLHDMHLQPQAGGGNREFNLALPVAGKTTTQMIRKPELFIKVKCNVHPWMFAYLSVVDHPWFAVTDENGNYALPAGLPPGHYTLAAVHLKAGEATQKVTVPEGASVPVDFTLDVPDTIAKATVP